MKLGDVSGVTPWKPGTAPPPGTYTARIDEASEGESKNGHPQFTIEWTVVGGQYDGAAINEWLTIPKTGAGHDIGLQKLVALVDAVGIDRSVDDFELSAEMLVGKVAQIVCISEQSYKDPEKFFTNVAGHKPALDVPQQDNGNGAAAPTEAPLPF